MGIYISQSLIEDFLSCNRKAYYRINKPELSLPVREMVIGDVVHKAIEDFWNDRESALDYSDAQLKSRLPDDKSALLTAEATLTTYFDKFSELLSPNDLVEQKFKVPHPKYPDVSIVGKMDRISNKAIFDWKTTKRPPTDISKSPQFILYHWAYTQLYKENPTAVYYASLTEGSLIMYKRDLQAEQSLIYDIIPDIVTAIKQENFIQNGIFRKACFRCSYVKDCIEEKNVLDSSTSYKK